MLYIITDTHLGHNNIIKYCNRPIDFSDKIIANWKVTVKPDDLVIHLGDVAWPNYYDALKELPGHKVLVRGNHDRKSDKWYMERGFDFVCTAFANRIEGISILFTHEPKISHDYDINVCGHLHTITSVNSTCAHYVLSLETTGYRVMPISELIKYVHKVLKETKNAKNG